MSPTFHFRGLTAMCLAIPMRVVDLNGLLARCEARGVERTVSLVLLHDEAIRPGDMVVVHGGRALSRIGEAEAAVAWALYDEMLAAETGEAPASPRG